MISTKKSLSDTKRPRGRPPKAIKPVETAQIPLNLHLSAEIQRLRNEVIGLQAVINYLETRNVSASV